jgi:hypothetical protein
VASLRAVDQLTDGEHGAGEAPSLSGEVVHADAVSGRTSSWKPFKSPISDLEKINLAARWDYQRDRVFVRSGSAKRRATQQATRRPQAQKAQKIVLLNAPPGCPRCEKKWRKRGRLVALRFAGLLRPIVDTIDRRGLRAHFLRKHLREVERFYGFLDNKNFNTATLPRNSNSDLREIATSYSPSFATTMFLGTTTMPSTPSRRSRSFARSLQDRRQRRALKNIRHF